jgi:Zn-dependent protease with chaperone function
MTTKIEICPECGAGVPLDPGFRQWCDHCNWNAGLADSIFDEASDSVFWKTYRRLSREKGKALFEQVTSTGSELFDGRSSGTKGRWLLVLGIYFALWGGTIALGALMLVFYWQSPLLLIVGLALLGLGWVIRPKLIKPPKRFLDRGRFPTLFRLADEVADAVGAQKPKFIRVNEDFNASVYQVGPKQEPVLTIGLSLWTILSSEEKVALLGHEFAHIVSGDPARGRWVGAANDALDSWLQILDHPTSDVYTMLGRVIFFPVTLLLRGLQAGLSRACFQESQVAEYRADYLAAKVAGTTAAKSLLLSLRYAAVLGPLVRTLSGGTNLEGKSAIELFKHHVGDMPEREKLRLMRCLLSEDTKVDAFHPPSQFRLKFLEVMPDCSATVHIKPETSQVLEAELTPLERDLSDRLYDRIV